jgi:hypothetical protein
VENQGFDIWQLPNGELIGFIAWDLARQMVRKKNQKEWDLPQSQLHLQWGRNLRSRDVLEGKQGYASPKA